MSLRRAFRYPAEDAEDDQPEGIDEQEQEEVIKQLAAKDKASTRLYRIAFMILPCASLLYFIHILYTASRSGHARFGSYATFYSSGILSLISCFFIIYHPWCEKLNINPALSTNKKILNGSIMTLHLGSMMVFLYYTIPTSNSPDSSALKLLVIVVFLATMTARNELEPLDLKELEGLRYDYKGA